MTITPTTLTADETRDHLDRIDLGLPTSVTPTPDEAQQAMTGATPAMPLAHDRALYL